MVIHICDRCQKEAEKIEKYMIPDFNNCNGIMSDNYYIYGRPVRLIENYVHNVKSSLSFY